MIVLPTSPYVIDATPQLVDSGGVLRSPFGSATRVNRGGAHYAVTMTLPPMTQATGRIWVSRLIRGFREGVEIKFPLLGVPQGIPGQPVVNGAGQSGMALSVRNLTPHYAALEGYWLSIEAASGQHYLHNIAGQVIASAGGTAVLPLSEPLRVPFADGDVVHLAKPMLQGLVADDRLSWNLSLARHTSLSFTIEEAG